MEQKNVILVLTMWLMLVPISAASQGISGVNVYAFRTVHCIQTGMDFFPENNTFRVSIVEAEYGSPDYTGINVGLGHIQSIFALDSIPSGVAGYIVVEEGDQVEIVNQLINWSLTPYIFQYDNGTRVDARLLTAFFYTFANHSVYNETTINPYYNTVAQNCDDKVILSESRYIAASEKQSRVIVDFDYNTDTSTTTFAIISIAVVGVVVITILIVNKKRKET